jgi:hypothetical protein
MTPQEAADAMDDANPYAGNIAIVVRADGSVDGCFHGSPHDLVAAAQALIESAQAKSGPIPGLDALLTSAHRYLADWMTRAEAALSEVKSND